jgi:hypothetical protein
MLLRSGDLWRIHIFRVTDLLAQRRLHRRQWRSPRHGHPCQPVSGHHTGANGLTLLGADSRLVQPPLTRHDLFFFLALCRDSLAFLQRIRHAPDRAKGSAKGGESSGHCFVSGG